MQGALEEHKDKDNIRSFSSGSLKLKRLVFFHTILNLVTRHIT